MSSQTTVLISGAGIAGPALAILLNKNGFKTTIVERSSTLRTSGQQIDVVGPGIELIRLLGIESAIRARTVHDEGIKFVTSSNRTIASFPASSSTASLVREIEIMRGDMADVFYQATCDQTEYIFNDRIDSISEIPTGTTVSFKNSRPRTFNLVIAADGLNSRTRSLAFPHLQASPIKSLHQWTALFLIPHSPADSTWSRAYSAPNGRLVLLRPDKSRGQTSVYIGQGQTTTPIPTTLAAQKSLVQTTFADLGWETPRILSHLPDAQNFYIQQTAQIKLPHFTNGSRVALLGDAGYCPSPVSGLGTTLALVGAYVLAGCLVTYQDDLPEALRRYEREMRPWVDRAQSLGPGVPALATPRSTVGVWVLRCVLAVVSLGMWVVGVSGLGWVLGWVCVPVGWVFRRVGWLGGVESMQLPKFEMMKGID